MYNYTEMVPRETHIRILNAGAYSKTIEKLQAWKTYQTTAFSLRSAPKKYGKWDHGSIPEYETPLIDKESHTHVQSMVVSFLWYACIVNLMVLMALSTLAM